MNTKTIKVILLILVLLTVATVPSIAITNFQVELNADKQTVHPGDTVKVAVSLTNIKVQEGLGTFWGVITYDTSIFETLSQDNITCSQGWGPAVYNPETGKIILETAEPTTKNTEIFQIALKVKEDAQIKTGSIVISQIISSSELDDYETDDVTLNIPITAKEPETNKNNVIDNNTVGNNTINNTTGNNTADNNTTGNNTASNNTTGNNTTDNNTVSNNTINNNIAINNTNENRVNNKINTNNLNRNTNSSASEATSAIPNAGVNNYIMPAIIILLAIAVFSYINYRRMKNI